MGFGVNVKPSVPGGLAVDYTGLIVVSQKKQVVNLRVPHENKAIKYVFYIP